MAASAATPLWLARVEAPRSIRCRPTVARCALRAFSTSAMAALRNRWCVSASSGLGHALPEPRRRRPANGTALRFRLGHWDRNPIRRRDALFSMWIEGVSTRLLTPRLRCGWWRTCIGRAVTCWHFRAAAGQAPTGQGRLILATARPSILERAPGWLRLTTPEAQRILQLDPLPQLHSVELRSERWSVALSPTTWWRPSQIAPTATPCS